MKDKIVFFGNERLATGVTTDAPVLRNLLASGYEIPALVIAQGETGSSRQERALEVLDVARDHNITVLAPADLLAAREQLAAFGAAAAVLVAYGKLVPQSVIDSFAHGIINVHPSLLPIHRGSTPIEHTILAGDTETGVSLMQLVGKMDAGAVYAQQTVALQGNESKQELANRLGIIGAQMVTQQLPGILDGSVNPVAQNGELATNDEQLAKTDGQLDFTKPSTQLEREVRAYMGWPRSRLSIGGLKAVVTQAHAARGNGTPGSLWLDSKQLGIYTAEGVFVIDSLIPEGKKEMTAEAFLAGYQLR